MPKNVAISLENCKNHPALGVDASGGWGLASRPPHWLYTITASLTARLIIKPQFLSDIKIKME